MAASHSAGGWIEICSGDGAVLIQLDGETPAPRECNHCSFCLIVSGSLHGVLAPYPVSRNAPDFSLLSYGTAQTTGLAGPAQYWSACRGPPIASTENTMSTSFSLPVKEQIQAASNPWGIPCL